MTFLVCGDSMIDIYTKGDTTRVSPEAPVPIVRVESNEERLGGAANVLANVLALKMPARGLYSPTSESNPVRKQRIISRGQQMLRLDYDHSQEAIPPEAFSPEPWIIFSDYGKGALGRVAELISLAPQSLIFVDPRGVDYERYRGAAYVKPNKDEMRDLVGGWTSEAQLETKALNVVQEFHLQGLLLTRGSEGMTLYTPTAKHHQPSVAQEVFDVCGAGDTSIATFAVALARGFSLKEALYYATKAAGITCRHLGSYAPTYKEVFSDPD